MSDTNTLENGWKGPGWYLTPLDEAGRWLVMNFEDKPSQKWLSDSLGKVPEPPQKVVDIHAGNFGCSGVARIEGAGGARQDLSRHISWDPELGWLCLLFGEGQIYTGTWYPVSKVQISVAHQGPGWYLTNTEAEGKQLVEYLESPPSDSVLLKLPAPPQELVDVHAGKYDEIHVGSYHTLSRKLSWSPEEGWLCMACPSPYSKHHPKWVPASQIFSEYWWEGPGWYTHAKLKDTVAYHQRLPGNAIWRRIPDPPFEDEEVVAKKDAPQPLRYKTVKNKNFKVTDAFRDGAWFFMVGSEWVYSGDLISLGQFLMRSGLQGE